MKQKKKRYIFILFIMSSLFTVSIFSKTNSDTPKKEKNNQKEGINKDQKEKFFNIKVKISKIKNKKGTIYLKLCKYSKHFPKKKNVLKELSISNLDSKIATTTFKNIPKGKYAVTIHHDQNNNKKVGTNFLGIPNEGLGVSNNAKGFMGPPSFKDASFNLNKDKTLNIRIKY